MARMQPETLFNLLSDTTRLRCLMLIQAEEEACVCEMTFALDESQPKISRHLALMRDAGLVTARRDGQFAYYSLTSPKTLQAVDLLREKGVRKVGPYMVPRTMSSTTSACLATPFKIHGVNYSISSAWSTSSATSAMP